MAKRGRRRKFRRYLRGQVDEDGDVGTLAGETLVGFTLIDVVEEKAWLSSVKLIWALDNVTAATNNAGPLVVGVCHSDYTAAEIEAWMEATNSWKQGDKVAQEKARRFIRRVGIFPGADSGSPEIAHVLNDGRPIHTKCGWMLTTGQTLKIWAYNAGTGAYATTAPVLHVQGHCNLWPA